MNERIIAIIIVFVWLFLGFLGILFQEKFFGKGKINWFGLIFLFSTPFLVFLGFLLDNQII